MKSPDEKLFALHTRPTDKGRIWYVQFRSTDGTRTTAKSTGIFDHGKKADRDAAVRAAQAYLDSGQIVLKERMTFEQYAKDFFSWEGTWAKEKVLRGKKISPEQAERHGLSVKNHLIPFFGTMRPAAIEDEDIRRFQRKMADDGFTGATINRVTVAMRLVLKGAWRDKLLRRMPIVEAVSERDQKERGTYTPAEIRALFAKRWPDFRAFVMTKLACSTGLRASECTALRRSCIHEDYVEVNQRWSPKWKLGPTKNRRTRIVPVPDLVLEDMQKLLAENPYKAVEDPFVFYDPDDPERPMDQAICTRALTAALVKIGIPDDPYHEKEKRSPLPGSRQARGLDLHAMRHTFNSFLIDKRIPMQTVQAVTGHLSPAMTQRYYHVARESMAPIRELQGEILGKRKLKAVTQKST